MEKKPRGYRISDPVHDAFSSVYGRSTSSKVEELMSEHLGMIPDSKRSELIVLESQAIKINEEIAKIRYDIENGEKIAKQKLAIIWKDFRKSFTIKQPDWKGDEDVVVALKNNYNIYLTYDNLFNIWDEMEDLE